jgi:hypothetical protein
MIADETTRHSQRRASKSVPSRIDRFMVVFERLRRSRSAPAQACVQEHGAGRSVCMGPRFRGDRASKLVRSQSIDSVVPTDFAVHARRPRKRASRNTALLEESACMGPRFRGDRASKSVPSRSMVVFTIDRLVVVLRDFAIHARRPRRRASRNTALLEESVCMGPRFRGDRASKLVPSRAVVVFTIDRLVVVLRDFAIRARRPRKRASRNTALLEEPVCMGPRFRGDRASNLTRSQSIDSVVPRDFAVHARRPRRRASRNTALPEESVCMGPRFAGRASNSARSIRGSLPTRLMKRTTRPSSSIGRDVGRAARPIVRSRRLFPIL